MFKSKSWRGWHNRPRSALLPRCVLPLPFCPCVFLLTPSCGILRCLDFSGQLNNSCLFYATRALCFVLATPPTPSRVGYPILILHRASAACLRPIETASLLPPHPSLLTWPGVVTSSTCTAVPVVLCSDVWLVSGFTTSSRGAPENSTDQGRNETSWW